ncbi:MAG: DUF748 domain-containing protein [Candidatus Sumerlaeia bacterium]|nr:DUF748 domain-containing protein [Candidatus Sumerlaeia bacterium]
MARRNGFARGGGQAEFASGRLEGGAGWLFAGGRSGGAQGGWFSDGQSRGSGVAGSGEEPPARPRRFRPLRRLVRFVLVLVLLLASLAAGLLFYLTSEAGLRHVVCPLIARQSGRDVGFAHARLRLHRGFEISRLRVGPRAGETRPLVKADYLAIEWSLPALLRGRLQLRDVTAEGLETSLVERPRDRARSARKAATEPVAKPSAGGTDAATGFLIERLRISNASFESVRLDAAGTTLSRYALRDVEARGSQLGLGRPAELDLSARIEASDPAQDVQLADGVVACKIASTIQAKEGAFSLSGQWAVSRLKGRFHGVEAGDLRATGTLQIEQDDPRRMEIRRADAAVFHQGRPGAEIALTGEMDPATADGTYQLRVRGVNRAFLNLLSTPDQPLDFCNTTVNARFVITTSRQGRRVTVDSEADLADFSIAAPQIADAPTPPAQMTFRARTLYDGAAGTLELESLHVKAVQEGREVLTARLSRPMTLSLASGKAAGAGRAAGTDAAAELAVKAERFALAQINPFLARRQVRIEAGVLTLDSAVSVGAAGGALAVRGAMDISDLRGAVAGSKVARTDLTADYDLTLAKGVASIKKLVCEIKQAGKPAGRIEGRGEIHPEAQKGEIVLSGDRIDLSALQMLLANLPAVRLRGGLVDFDQRIAFAGPQSPMRFTGRFDATDLNFSLVGNDRAQFAGWSLRGGNAVSYDPAKGTLDLTSASLAVAEHNVGRLRAAVKGQLATSTGAGKLSLDLREAGVPFLVSVLERIGAQPTGPVRLTDGILMGVVNLTLANQYADLAVNGSLRTQRLQWTAGTGPSAQRGARDLDATYDLAVTRSKSRNGLAIRDAVVHVTGAGAQPGSLRVKGLVDLVTHTGEISVQFERFDTAPAATLVGPLAGAWRPLGGVLHGQQRIKFAAGGEISAAGLLRAEQLRILPPQAAQPVAPPTVEVENAVALLRGGAEIKADRFSLRLFKDAARTGSLDASGRIDLDKGNAALTVAAVNFETDSIWPLLASFGTDLPLSGGRLNGKQEIRYVSAPSRIEARGNLRAESLRIQPAAGKQPLEPVTLDLNNDVVLTAEATTVRSLRLTSYSGGKPLDQIDLTAEGGGLQSKQPMNLALKAPSLHLDHYLAMLSSRGTDETKVAPPDAPAKAAPPSKSAPQPAMAAPFAVPGPPIRASLNIGKFYYDRLALDNVAAVLVTNPQSITVPSLTAKMFDGAATATFHLQTNVPGLPFNGAVKGRDIPVSPLLGLLSPGSENTLTGKGEAAVQFAGRGFDGAALEQNLRADGAFRISDGQMKNIPILSALASVTNVEQLSDISFFTFDARWKVEKAVVHIADATVVGRLQKLSAKGTVGFDQRVDLSFNLWLGGELKERLKNKSIFRYLRTESDRYLFLPVPIGMGGTLGKPRPTLNLPIQPLIDIGIEQGLNRLKGRTERK